MSLEFGQRCVLAGKVCLGLAGTILAHKFATSENFEKVRLGLRYLGLKLREKLRFSNLKSLYDTRPREPTPVPAVPGPLAVDASFLEAFLVTRKSGGQYQLAGRIEGLPCTLVLQRVRGPVEERQILDAQGTDLTTSVQAFSYFRSLDLKPELLGKAPFRMVREDGTVFEVLRGQRLAWW